MKKFNEWLSAINESTDRFLAVKQWGKSVDDNNIAGFAVYGLEIDPQTKKSLNRAVVIFIIDITRVNQANFGNNFLLSLSPDPSKSVNGQTINSAWIAVLDPDRANRLQDDFSSFLRTQTVQQAQERPASRVKGNVFLGRPLS